MTGFLLEDLHTVRDFFDGLDGTDREQMDARRRVSTRNMEEAKDPAFSAAIHVEYSLLPLAFEHVRGLIVQNFQDDTSGLRDGESAADMSKIDFESKPPLPEGGWWSDARDALLFLVGLDYAAIRTPHGEETIAKDLEEVGEVLREVKQGLTTWVEQNPILVSNLKLRQF
jgi:hypothetical protein